MAALTAATIRKTRNTDAYSYADYTVGTGATLYEGALVAYNTTTGRAVAASVTTGRKFLGLALETKTGVTAATVTCKVAWDLEALVNVHSSLTAAYVGSNAAVYTDNDVTTWTDAGTAGVRIRIGETVQLESGDAWVRLRQYSESDA